MILNKELVVSLMDDIRSKGRMIDYYLLKNIYDPQEKHIIEELRKFQNDDGGFGHALEADVRLPSSSVVCTDEALQILEEVKDPTLKTDMIQKIVKYYESVYKPEINGWELVPPEVDDYPRAVWWNYSSVNEFSYGNPNPQIIGFLYQNKEYLEHLDIDRLVDFVIDYILNVFPKESRQHNILSCLLFYNCLEENRQALIRPILKQAVDKELTDNWEEYGLQPYEVALINKDFLEGHEELLQLNLEYCHQKLEKGLMIPNWQWYQFEAEFERAKMDWAGLLTFKAVKALML